MWRYDSDLFGLAMFGFRLPPHRRLHEVIG